MVLCWVVAGYSFSQLWTLVSQTNGEDILPPRDPSDTSRFFIGPRRPGDKIVLAHKFTSQFKTMGVGLTDRQLDYVVWKSLVYVMRGCGKMITTASASNMASNYNVSFNYLPPGKRHFFNQMILKMSDWGAPNRSFLESFMSVTFNGYVAYHSVPIRYRNDQNQLVLCCMYHVN
jgi:hypothetical protein